MGLSKRELMKEKSAAAFHHKNSFINKLYDLIEGNREPQVIAWNSQGTGFIVSDRDAFSQRILPSLFSHKNITSFTRQLNLYNFKRCRSSRDKLCYMHPYFKKGRSDLLKKIQRNIKSAENSEKIAESCLSYEELMKENLALRERYSALEQKLKLSCEYISQLQKNGHYPIPAEVYTELYSISEAPSWSEKTEVLSKIEGEESYPQESSEAEPSLKKLVFEDAQRQYQAEILTKEDLPAREICIQMGSAMPRNFWRSMLKDKSNFLYKETLITGTWKSPD